GASQRTGRDIEGPIADMETGVGEIQQACGFFIHAQRAATRCIDLVNDVVIAVTAELLFYAPRFIGNPLNKPGGLLFILTRPKQLAGAGHGLEAALPVMVMPHQLRRSVTERATKGIRIRTSS